VAAGVLASIGDDYFVTGDGSWKCTTNYSVDWMQTSFVDSGWPPAVIATGNPGSPYGLVSDVSTLASWIWTRNSRSPIVDPVVYCRGHLREFVLYTVARKRRRWSLLGRHRYATHGTARRRTMPHGAACTDDCSKSMLMYAKYNNSNRRFTAIIHALDGTSS